MTINEVRKRYLEFMRSKGHAIVQSSSLVPENDPTTLFTAAGMQPMINYILGAKHTAGTRISDTQKCFRSQDIEEVGDNRHTTFFEMLGNWSFGDYFKKEQISFMYEFLTDKEIGLGLDKDRLYFSCYEGNEKLNLPKDNEAKNFWIENGIDESHISFYDDGKNWWSRSGSPEKMPQGEPGGPDSEIFFDFDPKNEKGIHKNSKWTNDECHPNCDCGRFVEIGNSVFIQYIKTESGLEELEQKNVDFGGGLTRMAAATENESDIFNLDIFENAKNILEKISNKNYIDDNENKVNFRIILDHIQAATFLIGDGVFPGNKDQMYFVRRLIRRAVVAGHKLGIQDNFTKEVSETFIEKYNETKEYLGDNLSVNREKILEELDKEESKFRKTLVLGMREIEKLFSKIEREEKHIVPGLDSSLLSQSFGFPIELTQELAKEKNLEVDIVEFNRLKEEHAEKSRTASEGMFKGGLADHSEITTALHTCCHLMLAGMKKVLGGYISQAGSNITPERLRFDFTFDKKVEDDEIKKIEEYVNNAIQNGFTVSIEEMDKNKAKESGVTGSFWDKYPEIVKVYTMKNDENIYSRELCGGPHIEKSDDYLKGKIFCIAKQEAVSAGVRRFKGVLK
ncbi:MAG: alanine--tRNA ligase [Candidatus Pacebacteria bacterium]|nr:alanine--tRNA ligase [Candidatus Paceibacterota bacterium]